MTVRYRSSAGTPKVFQSISGRSTDAKIFALEEESTFIASMRRLEKTKLRPLTYREALKILMNDEGIRNFLKGKWFWLAGEGLEKEGMFTIDKDGELRAIGKDEKLPQEKMVQARKGVSQRSLHINSDADTKVWGKRFTLAANRDPRSKAPVVVGVPIEANSTKSEKPAENPAVSELKAIRRAGAKACNVEKQAEKLGIKFPPQVRRLIRLAAGQEEE